MLELTTLIFYAEPPKIKIVQRLKLLFFTTFLILLLGLFVTACKDDEIPAPEFSWEENPPSQISFGDTVFIRFKAVDINKYRIQLKKGAKVIPLNFRTYFKDGDFYEAEVIFDDRYLNSGTYDWHIEVFIGNVSNSDLREVRYTGLALKQSGMALLHANQLEIIDTAGNTQAQYALSTKFDALKISPRDSLIYLLSLADKGVEIRRLKNFELLSQIPAPLGSNRQSYSNYLKTENGLYLFQMDGNVIYLESGRIEASTFVGVSGQINYVTEACILDNDLAAINAFADGSSAEVNIYNAALFQTIGRSLQGYNHHATALNEDDLAIISYYPNTDVWGINLWATNSGLFGSEKLFSADSVFDLAHLSGNDIVYCTDEGLHRYTFFGNSNILNIDPGKFKNFQIRKTDQALFLQKGNIVQRLLLNNNLQFAASSFTSLVDYEFIYNK